MPPPLHHHHGGHIPQSAFWNWTAPDYSPTFLIEQQPVPTWVWVAGGALVGTVIALLSRGR